MRTRWLVSAVLVVALTGHFSNGARAQGVSTYVEASGTPNKPRSSAGLAVQVDRLQMRAGLAMQARPIATPAGALQTLASGTTEVVPSLRSAFALAKNLDIETRVSFAEWNSRSSTTFDTRVRYKKALDSFFDEIDGSLWRAPDGLTKQSVRLGFNRTIGDSSGVSPLTLRGAATFEASQVPGGASIPSVDARRVGVEASLAGFMPALLSSDHRLSLKLDKAAGVRPEGSRTVAYDQSWTLGPTTELGLNLQVLRQFYDPANASEPSIGFSWRGRF